MGLGAVSCYTVHCTCLRCSENKDNEMFHFYAPPCIIADIVLCHFSIVLCHFLKFILLLGFVVARYRLPVTASASRVEVL